MTAVLPKVNAGDWSGYEAEIFNEEKNQTDLEQTLKFSIPPTRPVARSSIFKVFSFHVMKNLQFWQTTLSLMQICLADLSNQQPYPS